MAPSSAASSAAGSSTNGIDGVPGDAVVVPEELNKVTRTKELKDWSQIFFQFVLGAAASKVIKDL